METMRRRTAFTLFELLITLALTASVTWLVLPAFFGRSQHEQRLTKSAAEVAQTLRTARQQAIDKLAPVCFAIVDGTSSFRCYLVREPSSNHVGSLPPGFSIHALPAGPSRKVTEVIFREDGSATGADFEIRGPHGSKKVIVERLTGQTILEDLAP
jgi:type II secretory pathway pseudopilin PulG